MKRPRTRPSPCSRRRAGRATTLRRSVATVRPPCCRTVGFWVTWADGVVNELNELSLTPPDYGVYIYDPATRANDLVVNYEDSWELYAKPVVSRQTPKIIASRQT